MASVRLRTSPEQNLRISVLHFKMAGKLCFIPGYSPTLSRKLAPLHRYLDVLLLANSSIAEAAAGKKVKVDWINVNGEECAWVPLNGESMLQQVTTSCIVQASSRCIICGNHCSVPLPAVQCNPCGQWRRPCVRII